MNIPKSSLIGFFSNKVKQHGGINLAQGIPAFAPPAALLEIFREETARCNHAYPAGNGFQPLLEEILNCLTTHTQAQFNQKPVTLNNLMITQGATEAITLIYTYLNSFLGKFTTLAFEPVYESYKHLPRIFNQAFTVLPILPHIDFERFEKTVLEQNVKLVFVNSPGNPLGKIWTKNELDTLLNICLKHQVYVVLDTVYEELYFEERPYFPFKNLNDYIFYVGSFSKMYCITAWRIGYLMFSDRHTEAIRNVHDYTGLCATEIHQRTLYRFVNEHDWGLNYIEQLRKTVYQNYQYVKTQLEQLGFEIYPVEGGCFIWAKMPAQFTNCFEFAVNLYDRCQVAVVPGIHFAPEAWDIIRINMARPLPELEEGMKLMAKFV